MATFSIKVLSHRCCNKKDFCVSVSTDDEIYIRLKNKSVADANLGISQFLIFKFENSDEKNTYINWDIKDPKDKKRKSRHHVGEIDKKAIKDFNENYPNFTISKKEKDNLSWQVTCIQNENANVINDETVNVTFGEDQPDEGGETHNK